MSNASDKKQKKDEVLVIPDTRVIFKNFSGKPDDYNRAGGVRSVNIELDPTLAKQLKADGWNVRMTKPSERYPVPVYHTSLKINYRSKWPPQVFMVSNGVKNLLDEHTVGSLDFLDIVTVGVEIHPYHWSTDAGKGVKGYVNRMFVVVRHDELSERFDPDCVGEHCYVEEPA